MARLPASGSDVARWPPSRCQGCGCLVHVPCVHCAFSGTLRGEFKCVSNSLTAQRCGLASRARRATRQDREILLGHTTGGAPVRPSAPVARCTHIFCRHTVPSSVWLLPCIAIRTATKFESKGFHLSSCLQVFTCSLGSLCFFESSTHSATALGLADPDYTIPTLINSEHRRTSPSLLDRMQYFNPGSVGSSSSWGPHLGFDHTPILYVRV